ncbi:type I-E CRISPR-associated protein Cas6/Cse3/CasE [Leucobacter iarius]|uniref:Type I-E CRISPR-associated protein Cas6/Cse3/CasE n=1 Tax=Leucobacter iarius TaxID=333963 RepID=A0ABN2LQT8_9MICO
MYLTRFQINPRRRGAMKLLANAQAMHAAVLHGFPDPSPTDTGRVLWRLDRVAEQSYLVISSPAKPDLTHLVEQAGWPALESGWQTKNTDEHLARISTGQRWGFRLTGNPVHALKPEDGAKRGKIVAHRTSAHQLGWLERQGEKHGFALATQEVEAVDAESGSVVLSQAQTVRVARSELRRFPREGKTVTVQAVEFDGVLEVTDADRFRDALRHGVGPARAYGCGLLTVARIG